MATHRRPFALTLFFGSFLLVTSCDRKSEIQKALPASVRDVRVSRTPAPGSPEGDSTYTLEATFPSAAACQSFITAYAPRENLVPDAAGYSRDIPGRESWRLDCEDARMKYEHVLY